MGTTTCLVLRKRVAQACNDFLEVAVTTAINNDNDVVSTNLNAYDLGMDGYFDGWWCYITDKANIGVFRMVSSATSYDTDLGVITVLGAALADDSTNEATIRLSRYDPALYLNAINDSIRDTYPNILRYKDDLSLITGNILPPFNWVTAGTETTEYDATNGSIEKTTTGGLYRNGPTSAKVTASAANGYLSIHSDNHTWLLDLQNKTVTVKVWALPEVANDAAIVIYTKQADGTTQTMTSTTSNPAGEFTLLKLEDQALNNDLVEVEVRLKVATNTKYVYFDPPRLIGRDLYEYLLPSDLQDGTVRDVLIQTSGYSDDICDDIHPRSWEAVYGWELINDGTDTFLRLPYLYSNSRRIRLIGDAPLEVISGAANVIDAKTISLSEEQPLSLLIKYAEYKLFEAVAGAPASVDVSRYERAAQKALGEYYRLLPSARMMRTGSRLNVRRY